MPERLQGRSQVTGLMLEVPLPIPEIFSADANILDI